MRELTSEEEFTRAYEEYGDALFRHCYFRLYDRDRARDLVQETFIRAWTYRAGGARIDNVRAFLYRVLTNLIIDETRRKKAVSLEELAAEGFDPSSDERARLAVLADAAHVLRVVDTLGEDQRTVILMRYVDDLKLKDIARALGVSETVVSVRLWRATRTLKARLAAPDRSRGA